MTNADRIRAMTDEELRDLIIKPLVCPVDKCPDTDCDECWLNWLKEAAE